MRKYDEPIEVRRGLVAGQEAPEQFIWRGRLWVVREVVSHWVETGAWWDQEGIAALLGVGAEQSSVSGAATASTGVTAVPLGADLLAESDLWRVEAARGGSHKLRARRRRSSLIEPVEITDDEQLGYGVFDLAFDWTQAQWRLVGCVD